MWGLGCTLPRVSYIVRAGAALLRRRSPRAGIGSPGAPPGPFGPFDFGTPDGFEFFLKLGPLRNLAAVMERNGPMLTDRGASNLCAPPSQRVEAPWPCAS